MKFKYLLLIVVVAELFSIQYSYAVNIELEQNKKNCEKISNISSQFEENVAADLNVSERSLTFKRAVYTWDGCRYLVDTEKGPYYCNIPGIIDPQDGNPVFAVSSIGFHGSVGCRK